MRTVFSQLPFINAPHFTKRTSSIDFVFSVKLSKRELDFVLFFLLPCGAKPSALVLYVKALL